MIVDEVVHELHVLRKVRVLSRSTCVVDLVGGGGITGDGYVAGSASTVAAGASDNGGEAVPTSVSSAGTRYANVGRSTTGVGHGHGRVAASAPHDPTDHTGNIPRGTAAR